MGDVIQAALDGGLHMETVVFSGHTYVDIGTPEGLARAIAMAGKLTRLE